MSTRREFATWTFNDPKLGLHSEIKVRQAELNDPDLILNAFILSYPPHGDLLNVGTAGSKAELEDRNVLFMDEGRNAYLIKLFRRIEFANWASIMGERADLGAAGR